MDSALTSWLLTLIAGAIGGNAAGAVLKDQSLGGVGNTIEGIVGGGLGGQILSGLIGGGAGGPSVVGNIAGSGIGGAVLMIVVGFIKNAMAK